MAKESLEGLHQFRRKNESTRERYSCFNGRHKPMHKVHKYTSEEEDIETVCKAYKSYYKGEYPPSQHNILKEHLNLYFKKTHSSLLEKKHYL